MAKFKNGYWMDISLFIIYLFDQLCFIISLFVSQIFLSEISLNIYIT